MGSENLEIITAHAPSEKEMHEIFEIWQEGFPKNVVFDSLSDFQAFVGRLVAPTFLLTYDSGAVAAFLIYFTRDDNTWFIMAVSQAQQRRGLGRLLIQKAQLLNLSLYGWVVATGGYSLLNNEPYISPLAFYIKQGFRGNFDEKLAAKGLATVRIEWANPT